MSSGAEAAQITLLKEQMEATRKEDHDEAVTKATARAKIKAESVKEDAENLEKVLTSPVALEDWDNADDLSIEQAMKNLNSWRDEVKSIVTRFREIKDILAEVGVEVTSIEEIVTASDKVDALKELFDQVRDAVEFENLERELYCLDIATTEKSTYPTFEGKEDECFATFKEKIENAFIQNRVKKSSKVSKLRECLKGHARKLVPVNLVDINRAFETLEKAFGHSTRVLNFKINSLKKIGQLPRFGGKGGTKNVVEWYLQLEGLVQGMLDLEEKSDNEDIQHVVHSLEIVRNIAALFPPNKGTSISSCKGKGRLRLEAVLDLVKQYREDAQSWLQVQETQGSQDGSKGHGSGHSQSGSTKSGRSVGQSNSLQNINISNFTPPYLPIFNPPVNYPDCRVCQTLEKKGDTAHIYDSHHSSFPTGCPRFISMDVKERLQICKEAKYCLKCLDNRYKYLPRDTNHKCAGDKKRKCKFTCPEDGCKSHLWICLRHRDKNTAIFDKLREEILQKFKLHFVFVAGKLREPLITEDIREICPNSGSAVSSSSRENRVTRTDLDSASFSLGHLTASCRSENGLAELPLISTASEGNYFENNLTGANMGRIISSNTNTFSPKNSIVGLENDQVFTQCNSKHLSQDEALFKLQEKLNSNEKLQPISKGIPQFMLGYTKGKTKPLPTLYDTGCLTVLFKEGVPKNELAPAVMKTKGPIWVNGVGNTSVKVNDEWMCSVKLNDGSRAVLEGLCVDEITVALPLTKLDQAVDSVKADFPENLELQNA